MPQNYRAINSCYWQLSAIISCTGCNNCAF